MTPSLLTRTENMVFNTREVIDRGDHLVIRTPTNPSFYNGNQVTLPGPPHAADLPRLEALFVEAFGTLPHRCFEWAGGPPPPEDVAVFEAAGYSLSTAQCMTTARPRLDQPIDTSLRVERVRGNLAWGDVLSFWIDCAPRQGFVFAARMAADHASRPGPGDWWIARDGAGRVVGSLGLYFGEGHGRFQNIQTHAGHRRQGVCRTLMTRAMQYAVEHYPFDALVIAADVDDFPRHLYASFGFEPVHLQTEMFRAP